MTDDQCNKFLTLLVKDTQSPSFVCPECEYIDWSPIDHLANPLPVIRWMEKEMPEVWEEYLEFRFHLVHSDIDSYAKDIAGILDLRNLVRWLIENPTWGEEICTQVVPLTDSFTAQRLMRHKDKRSTDNYYHAYSDRLLEVVQKNENVVELKKTEEKDKK